MRRLFVVLALAVPAIASAEQRWLRVASRNFELYTTAGERRARETILYFEQVRGFFLRASGAKPSTKAPVRIVAFNSEKDYKPYRIDEGAAGYAGGGPDRDEIVMGGTSSESYPIATHEYVHILLKPFRKMPLCLNEGQAELFSTLRPIGNKIVVGDVPPGRGESLLWSKWLDLESLFAVDHSSPYYKGDSDKRHLFYAESWALAHMLFLADGYRGKTSEFLHQVNAGATPAEAFERAFGKNTRQALADLQAYIRGGSLKGLLFDMKLEKTAEEPDVRPATQIETGIVLAGLLVDIHKEDEARRAYDELARENPGSPEVPEALGYLGWRSNRTDVACEQFARAVALGSRNARMYHDYASLLGAAGGSPQQQVELLSRAVELDPELREARFNLAMLLLAEHDHKGALKHFGQIKQVEPDRAFRYFYAVAYASYSAGDMEGARANIVRAAKYAADDGDRTSLAHLRAALDSPPVEELGAAATEERPSLARPPAQQAPAGAPSTPARKRYSTVEGTLEQLDCLKEVGRIRIATAGGAVRLIMDDPDAIELRGLPTGQATFDCGPQKPRRVLVEYEPAVDDELGTAGVVRAIEFK